MMIVNIVMMMKIFFFKWYDGYKKRKFQKASIKEGLLPIACHLSRWQDWCKAKPILKDIVPRGFDAKIEGIQEKHRQAIEKKDTTITLLNDDLKIANTRT